MYVETVSKEKTYGLGMKLTLYTIKPVAAGKKVPGARRTSRGQIPLDKRPNISNIKLVLDTTNLSASPP